MIFFVCIVFSYSHTDLSLLKEFLLNLSFANFYIFHQIFPNSGHDSKIMLAHVQLS